MSVKVLIPTPLRIYAGRRESVEVDGATVQEVLANLITEFKDLRRHLYTDEGRLRSFVNVCVNDEDIRYLDKEQTGVRDADVVSIVPSIAGGAPAGAEQGKKAGEDARGPRAGVPETRSVSGWRAGEDARAPGETVAPPPSSQPAAPRSSAPGGTVAPPRAPAAARLSNEEILRYSRHLIMPEVGMDGQLKLKQARVLCIGAGGLGSPLALYLGAAGVGTLGIVDFDVVDFTNLQRQVIHGTRDVGRPKLDSAVDRLRDINPTINVVPFHTRLSSENALEIFRGFDIVADGTDNFPTRYLVNDACVLLGKPNVYASIFRFEGQASVFGAPGGPCYRCLYPEPPPPGLVPSCAEGGVLGILPGLVGVIQATEVIKLILGKGRPLVGRLLLIDALEMKFRELKLRKHADCPICGEHRTIHELIDYEQFCGIRGQEQQEEITVPEITPVELKQRLDSAEPPFVLDVREPHEYQICHIGGHLLPLGELPQRVHELNTADEIVVHCRSGVRSARAVDFLRKTGFRKVWNLKGGILAWADQVDATLPKY